MLDDPGRVRSQIINVVCQIERFDFDCNMVVRNSDAKSNNMNTHIRPFKVVRGSRLLFTWKKNKQEKMYTLLF